MDIYSTGVLNLVVADLLNEPQAPMFLLDRYFPKSITMQTEEIFFDTVNQNQRLAPFVSPLVAGQIVERKGFKTQSLRPAYVKDKRVLDANAPYKRVAGEQIMGSLSPGARMERLIATESQDQLNMLRLRKEVMAAQALTTGAVTISGDQYETVVIDYGRDASVEFALSGAAEWGDAGIDPLADLETWTQAMAVLAGVSTVDIVMDPKAWGLFRGTAAVTSILNRTREESTLKPYGQQRRPGEPMEKGQIGGFNVFVYQRYYIDPADNTQKQLLPDYSVFGAAPEVEGYQIHGAIRDHDAGLVPLETFSKSWVVPDPSVRYLMMQSAPLVVPFRPNASFYATVHA